MLTPEQLNELVEMFDWNAWSAQLRTGLTQLVRDIVLAQGDAAAALVGGTFDRRDPFVSWTMTNYVGERIVSLEQTTRQDVTDLIRKTIAETQKPGTPFSLGTEIADKIRERFADYRRWRADRIARTETAIAYNYGSVLGWKQSGVTQVRVLDGDCDICKLINGQIWTLDEALRRPVEHPNCERSFEPIPIDAASAAPAPTPEPTPLERAVGRARGLPRDEAGRVLAPIARTDAYAAEAITDELKALGLSSGPKRLLRFDQIESTRLAGGVSNSLVSLDEVEANLRGLVSRRNQVVVVKVDGRYALLRGEASVVASWAEGKAKVRATILNLDGARAALKQVPDLVDRTPWPIAEGEDRVDYKHAATDPQRLPTGAWWERISRADRERIIRYTGSSYEAWNQQLRGVRDHGQTVAREAAEAAAAVDRAVEASGERADPILVWRKVRIPNAIAKGRQTADYVDQAYQPGTFVQKRGIQSTATSTGQWSGEVIFEIRTRWGAYVDPISRNQGEQELLLPHNSLFRVAGVEKNVRVGGREFARLVRLDYIHKGASLVPEKDQIDPTTKQRRSLRHKAEDATRSDRFTQPEKSSRHLTMAQIVAGLPDPDLDALPE